MSAELLKKRRTSRIGYDDRPLNIEVMKHIQQEAKKFGHTLVYTDDPATIDWVNRLNGRMVFYDLDEDNVRDELAKWSRFTKKQAQQTADGLSAECLNVPGWGLWVFMKHYGLFKLPVVKPFLKWLYTKNMVGVTTVAWIQGPFHTIKEQLEAGRALLRVWLLMAHYGISYQPYGSVITNNKAHAEFVGQLNIDESNTMAWLLMRLGHSQEPPRSMRLPKEEFLL